MQPPLPNNSSSQSSKEQELSGFSSGFIKPYVLGTLPMIKEPRKMPKNKGIIPVDVEVIDVDKYEDYDNSMFIQDNFDTNDKGKGIYTHSDHQLKIIPVDVDVIDVDKDDTCENAMLVSDKFDTGDKGKGIYHYSDHQLKEMLASHSFNSDMEILESANEVESNLPSASHSFIDLDNNCSDPSSEGDEWIPFDEIMDVDAYSALQAHFDHMDIPPDIEAPIPWLPHGQNGNKADTKTSSFLAEPPVNPGSVNELEKPAAHLKLKTALANSLDLSAEIDVLDHPPEGIEPFSLFPSKYIQPNKKSAASRYRDKPVSPHEVSYINSLPGMDVAKSRWFLDSFKCSKKKLHGSTNISINRLDAMKLHNGGETSDTSDSVKKPIGLHYMPHSNFPEYVDFFKPMEEEQSMSHCPEYVKMKNKEPFFAPHIASGFYESNPLGPLTLGEVVDMPWVQHSSRDLSNLPPGDSTSVAISPADLNERLGNFEHFKQFDTVEDHSDHHYTCNGFSMKQPSKKWTKKIQEEWKILEKDLPETIFVRVYESRMDLMRAVIIGAEGTPYHDGLFFFDIFFPNGYPDVPPKVHYHSGGLRLNPNLYACGKVCLSLLNTWGGSGNEKWVPGMSTMLQVLVSIQGLILNTKPYFNEPGYEYQSGSDMGEKKSRHYNEETLILSIKTMVYNIRRPPKHFDDFVLGHFFQRAHDILAACKAYVGGAQVGSLVKGSNQNLVVGSKTHANHFEQTLNHILSMLVDVFKKIGVGDCEKFLPPLSPQPIPNARKRVGRHSKAQLEGLEGDGAEKLVLG